MYILIDQIPFVKTTIAGENKVYLLLYFLKIIIHHKSQYIISFFFFQIPVPPADISSYFLGSKFRRPKPDRPGCFTGYIQLATPKTIESMAQINQTTTPAGAGAGAAGAGAAAGGNNLPPPLNSF